MDYASGGVEMGITEEREGWCVQTVIEAILRKTFCGLNEEFRS